MKVLYSCLSQSWGGMEMFTITAVNQLLKRNLSVDLLCYPNSRIHREASKQGIKCHTIKASSYFHPLQIIKLSSLIKKEKFDLIHSQASKDLWVIVPALKLVGLTIPLFITKQVGSFIVKKDALHKFIYNRVTKAFAISEVIKKNLIDTTPLSENKIEILHNGIVVDRFNPLKSKRNEVRKEFNIEANDIVIGMLARFSWGKGHEEFLFAAKELIKKYDNLKFMIVGEPSRGEDEYAQKIKSLAEEYGLKDTVIFTGYRADTPDVLSAMDIFAFPSHSEAFGIALVEAMAMGLPSVCSNSDGVLDIAVDNETSFLFQKKDGKDLAKKLSALIEDPQLRLQFGTKARQRVIDKFDIEILTDKVINYYREELAK